MNKDAIEKILQQIDIVDVISDYLSLKKSGTNFKGLCPFHNEKTPSFVVSQDKQIFHCFGCHEGGDAISFLMKIEHLSFPEAVQMLAQKAGIIIDLHQNQNQNQIQNSSKNNLYEINEKVAEYYHKILLKTDTPSANNARQYLKNRGFNSEIVKIFKIGYTTEDFDGLLRFATKNRIDEKILQNLGLLKMNKFNKLQDWFINRIIFPIKDSRSRVIAFGGRVLDDSLPKYLNSPETEIFKKSNVLYGLDLAIQHIKEQNQVLVLEGYVDVISLFANGIKNAVATLGTALGDDHIKNLKRYTSNIVLIFDGDDAGIKASLRSVDIFLKYSLNVSVVLIPNKMDPDDFVKKFGKEKFIELIEHAKNAFEYKLEAIAKNKNLREIIDRENFIKEVFETIKNVNDRLKLNSMFRIIADVINENEEDIRYEFNKFFKKFQTKTLTNQKDELKHLQVLNKNQDILIERNFLEFLINAPNKIIEAKNSINLDWIHAKNIKKIIQYLFENEPKFSHKKSSEILREALLVVEKEEDREKIYKALVNSILNESINTDIESFKDKLEFVYLKRKLKEFEKTDIVKFMEIKKILDKKSRGKLW